MFAELNCFSFSGVERHICHKLVAATSVPTYSGLSMVNRCFPAVVRCVCLVHTGSHESTAKFFRTYVIWLTLRWALEVAHGGSIYTIEISKLYRSDILFASLILPENPLFQCYFSEHQCR